MVYRYSRRKINFIQHWPEIDLITDATLSWLDGNLTLVQQRVQFSSVTVSTIIFTRNLAMLGWIEDPPLPLSGDSFHRCPLICSTLKRIEYDSYKSSSVGPTYDMCNFNTLWETSCLLISFFFRKVTEIVKMKYEFSTKSIF